MTMRLSLVLLILLLTTMGCGPSKNSGNKKALKEFESARALVVSGKYDEGIAALEAYLKKRRTGKYSSRAAFFFAKAQLGKKDYDSARKAFNDVINTFPGTNEAHKSRYKLALIELDGGDTVLGHSILNELATDSRHVGTMTPEAALMLKILKQDSSTK